MKKHALLSLILCSLLAGVSMANDTITLKDGTTYKGKITKETAEEIVMSIEIRAGIREEKTFKKSELTTVAKSKPEDLAFEKISTLVPTPDRLSAADYRRIINREVKTFLTAFPKSKQRSKVEEILKILENELALVEAGGMKLVDQWLTAEEIASDAYELDAKMLLLDIMKFGKGDERTPPSFVKALRKFEELEKNYKGSDSYLKAREPAKELLKKYSLTVKRDLSQANDLIKSREKELMSLNVGQRKTAMEDIQRQSKNYTRRIEFEKRTKTKWFTLDPYQKKTMAITIRNIEKALKDFEKFNPEKIKPASAAYRDAWQAASLNNAARVKDLISELKSAKVPKEYIERIETRLEEKATAAASQ